jgi:hypothetical protein
MKTRTLLIGIGFLCAWFIGAVLVEKIGLPTAIYAITVVGLEIATMISAGSDLVSVS